MSHTSLAFLRVHTSTVYYIKSVCIYAIDAAVIIKIFGSQVKSSRLNYSIEYCVVTVIRCPTAETQSG